MTMAQYSLAAAIGWAAAVIVAVLAVGRTRVAGASRPGSSAAPAGLALMDLVAGAIVGLVAYVGALLAAHTLQRMTVFGSMSVTYLMLVVGVPLAAVGILVGAVVRRRRRRDRIGERLATRPALVICAGGLLLAPIGFYATHIEPGLLDVDRPAPLAVAAVRAGEGPITIGVLTDIQTPDIGDRERAVVDELMAAEPDLILLPGDVIQADDATFDQQLPALRELLNRLSAPGGVFLVGGDVDKPLERLPRMVESTGVRYLDDEIVTTTVQDRTVTIGGIGVDYRSSEAEAVVDTLVSEPGDDDIRILLSHRPDPVLGLPADSRIDLQVSGHTHGGQVSIPFIGPLMTLSSVPRHVGAGGLHDLAGNAIYVGKGVGLERGQAPQLRFGVRPNIGVVTIDR